MPVFNNILAGSSGQATGYDIDQSVRLDNAGADNAANYLARMKDVWTTDGNQKTWTISWWMKWDNEDSNSERWIYHVRGDLATSDVMGVDAIILDNEQLQYYCYVSGFSSLRAITKLNRKFRDPAAWHHCMMVMDSTLASNNDRLKIYVNGVRETSFATDSQIGQDQTTNTNMNANTYVGASMGATSTQSFGGYLAEFHRIDGQALGPESFGETNSATNQWVPVEYTGSYGTNGFYLPFSSTELANSFSDDSGGYLVPSGVTSVEVLVVAGGGAGSGGGSGGGGGGAGGLVYISNYSVTPGERIDVTVGAGGAGRGAGQFGLSGENSVFGNITAIGGGGGGEYSTGKDGGSGGGGWASSSTAGGSSTQTTTNAGYTSTGWGNDGGQGGNGTPNQGGGGGGAGAAGVAGKGSGGITSIPTGGNGGIGRAYTIADGSTSVYYAGGGGGGVVETGSSASDTGQGGSGGGGTGGYGTTGSYTEPTAATANTGGGGGGGRNDGGGASGGSGVVIVYDGTTRTTFTSSTAPYTINAYGDVANTRAQYKIGNSSIKFDGSGDYLSIADPGWNWESSWTVDFWVRFSSLSSNTTFWSQNSNQGEPKIRALYDPTASSGTLTLNHWGSTNESLQKTNLGLSTNTWYHFEFVQNGASSAYMFVDGTLEASGTWSDTSCNPSHVFEIGREDYESGSYLNGYIDEFRVSDTARHTSSFTPSTTAFTADANTLLLIHSDFNGGIGADSSGNTNDFTPTNLVATDQVLDSPTNNFATLNSILDVRANTTANYAEGNLQWSNTASGYSAVAVSTIKATGKIYFEGVATTLGSEPTIGFARADETNAQLGPSHQTNDGTFIYEIAGGAGGRFCNGATVDSGPSTASAGDIISVAYDTDSGKVWFAVNGTWYNSGNPATGANASFTISSTFKDNVVPSVGGYNSGVWKVNFGADSSFAGSKTAQGNGGTDEDFYYTPPTGYKALNSSNLDDPAIALPEDYFDTKLWQGTSAIQSITGLSFQPDFLWIKARTQGYQHSLRDSIRGSTKTLRSNATHAEQTQADSVTSFNSDGWSMGADTDAFVNYSTSTYVGWAWKGGGTAVSNTDGSITSSVSANTTAGFSIVSYTGHGSTTGTVGHGLGVKPDLIITKYLSGSASWAVYNSPQGATKVIFLDDTSAEGTGITYWRDTEPTTSVFSVGASGTTGGNANPYIAYCFASIEGYSKVGSYTGNGLADGVFIYLGFKPEFFLIKNVDATEAWEVWDGTREPHNKLSKKISPNTDDAEYTANTTTYAIDFLSNGVKLRTSYSAVNGSNTFLYYAVASSPFKYSNAR